MTSKQRPINIVTLAYEILDMQAEILLLRKENERLKDYENKYNKLVDESIQHGNVMMGNLLKASLNMKPEQLQKAFSK